MKKQLEDKKSVKSSTNTTTDKKKQPTQRDASGSRLNKGWRESVKHHYKTIEGKLVKNDFDEFIQKENLTDKVKERKLKLVNLKSISKAVQHLIIAKKVKNISTKYTFRFKDNTFKIISISKNV